MALPRTQTRYPNGTTQGESKNTDPANHADPKRLTDPVRACMHTSSVGLTAFKKVRLKGSAPGFIVSHSQEKWKWTAGSSQSTGSLGTSPSQKSGFQVQVRASQPAPSRTTPPRTLQYPDEVKGAEQTPTVGGELQSLRLNA